MTSGDTCNDFLWKLFPSASLNWWFGTLLKNSFSFCKSFYARSSSCLLGLCSCCDMIIFGVITSGSGTMKMPLLKSQWAQSSQSTLKPATPVANAQNEMAQKDWVMPKPCWNSPKYPQQAQSAFQGTVSAPLKLQITHPQTSVVTKNITYKVQSVCSDKVLILNRKKHWYFGSIQQCL